MSVLFAQDDFLLSDAVRLHYVALGQGEPVCLVHGFLASLETGWGESVEGVPTLFSALALNYRVIAFDCRGHGKSEKQHDPEQYGIKMVEDVSRLLDHLHISRAHIVGYSMGAEITAKMLATTPQRMLSAVLGGCGAYIRDRFPESRDVRHERAAEVLESGGGLKALLEIYAAPNDPTPTEAVIAEFDHWFAATQDGFALACLRRRYAELSLKADDLRGNSVPSLALIGTRDPNKPSVDFMAEWMPSLEVVPIAKADHSEPLYRPEFVAHLRSFLRRQSAGTSACKPTQEMAKSKGK